MRSSNMHSSILSALNEEYDRQCDAARVVLNKFVTDNSAAEVDVLIMMSSYANVMFRFVWTDAETFGQRIFTSPLKFAVDARDLDLVLRLRKIADAANKLDQFEQLVAEQATPVFYKRYRTTLAPEETINRYRSVLDTTPKPIVGHFHCLHAKPARKINSVSSLHLQKLSQLISANEDVTKIKSRH